MTELAASRDPVGRTALLAELAAVVDLERGVTLTGPGGMGKTTLAIALASGMDRPGRPATLVDLVGVTDARAMAAAVAAALDVHESEDRDLDTAIDALLGQRPTLLVLDNLEQVDDAGRWIETRLRASTDLHVLGTSRVALGFRGEVERPVPGLELPRDTAPEAVSGSPAGVLFLGAARAAGADVVLDETTAPDVARLLEALDGMPLAIELAAGRTRILSPRSMLGRLAAPDTLARAGGDDRHRSLDAVLRWSIDLLEPGPRRLLGVLSPWAGWFPFEVAEALYGSTTVVSALDVLVRTGLVRTTPDEGELRFRVLETIRAAVGHGSDDDARAAATWLAKALDGWPTTLHGITPLGRATFPQSRQAAEHLLSRLVPLHDESALELAAASAPYFQMVGVLRETEARLRIAAQSSVPLTAARAQLGLGQVREALHGGGAGTSAIDAARTIAAGVRHAGLVLAATYWRGITGLNVDEADAGAWLTQAVELATAAGRTRDVLVIRARLADMGQPPDDVRPNLIALLGEVRLLGDPDMLSSLLNDLAANEAMLGMDQQALEHASESARINVEAGMELRAAWVGSIAAASAARLGRSEEARVRLLASATTILAAGPAAQGFVLSMALPVLTVLGHGVVAARCVGAREAHLERGGQAISPWENDLWLRDIVSARRASDAVAWQVAFEAGRREPLEAVVSTLVAALRTGAADTRKASTMALTTREVEVLALVGEAMSDADIGRELFISPKTASVHVANIKAKLGLESRVEVALRARELGLVAAPD